MCVESERGSAIKEKGHQRTYEKELKGKGFLAIGEDKGKKKYK